MTMRNLPSPVVLSEISPRGPGVIFNDPKFSDAPKEEVRKPEPISATPEQNAAALEALGKADAKKTTVPSVPQE